ncbi:glycoside hydrolase superfamily [Obelidium mucronatum]|nr:glycoside hydrolase superfamily [Obelidium mucronatum]
MQSHSALGSKLPSDIKAHEWTDTAVRAPQKASPFFEDQYGRKVHLRGVNMCGHSKLPTLPMTVSTHLNTADYFSHKSISFVGRPFPLSEAEEHFSRVKGWGLSFVRLLVTWEALEHEGPGIYDEDFIDYLIKILEIAERNGVKCFIDPHQDTWSRFSGGSGAPGWTFEVAGMDMTAFDAVGAAHVHNFNEDVKNPHQFWPTNYAKLACATMFTLFFGGEVFAPNAKYQGINVSTFLQEKYIACYTHLAQRIKACNAVVGFELMNEPHYGYIGLKDLKQFDQNAFLHYGRFPSPLQSFALGSGMAVEVDFYVPSWPAPSRKSGTKLMNSEKRSAWLEYGACVWKQHGVWGLDESGKPKVLKPDYFTRHPETGKPIDFYNDFYMPLMRKYTSAIHSVNPDHLVFFEPIPNEDPPILNEADRGQPNLVYSPHWYDLKALWSKSFDEKITFDIQALVRGTKSVFGAMYLGRTGAERNYTNQMRNIMNTGKLKVGDRPVLMGECGIPMDFNEKKAYETGDYYRHNIFLDAVISSMESNMYNFTLWNYNPDNDNEFGDHWNGEDFSIFSPNSSKPNTPKGTPKISDTPSETPPIPNPVSLHNKSTPPITPPRSKTITKPQPDHDHVPESPFEITGRSYTNEPMEGDPVHSHHIGGRALDAAIRPYAAKIAGTPQLSKFNLSQLVYTLEFTTLFDSSLPSVKELLDNGSTVKREFLTEVFLPNFHFKLGKGCGKVVVEVSDGEWRYDQKRQTLLWHYDPAFIGRGVVCSPLGDVCTRDGTLVSHRLVVSVIGVPVSSSPSSQKGVWGVVKGLYKRI